ncbi:MAG: Ig-like domain-containing protein, partial [Enterovibrio sp.]
MSRFFKSLFALIVLPLLVLLTGCDSEGAFSESTVKLERIDIAPLRETQTMRGKTGMAIPSGHHMHLDAHGHFSDGSERGLVLTQSHWQTDNRDIGYFEEPGVLIAGSTPGEVTVSVTKNGVTSNTLMVTVTPPLDLTKITVTPAIVKLPNGESQELTAMATYNDMYSIDVTDSVTWHLDNPSIATVSEGVLTGDAAGETILTATKDGVTSNNVSVTVTLVQASSIEITPSPVKMPIGPALQLNARAGYSDGSSYDVTNTVKWKLADTDIATVTQDGKLTGLAVGETTLTATKNGVTSNPVTVTISDAVITAVQLTPSPANVVKAQTLPLRVIATYSDNSTFDLIDEGNLEWSIGDTAIAEVTKGQLQGLQEGTTTVTVTKDGVTSNKATVNVTPAVITAISLSSPDVIIPNGLTKQLQVKAHYSDKSNSDITERVTWSVDESIAVVSPEGVLTGVGVGKTLLRAFLDGVSSNIIEFT